MTVRVNLQISKRGAPVLGANSIPALWARNLRQTSGAMRFMGSSPGKGRKSGGYFRDSEANRNSLMGQQRATLLPLFCPAEVFRRYTASTHLD